MMTGYAGKILKINLPFMSLPIMYACYLFLLLMEQYRVMRDVAM